MDTNEIVSVLKTYTQMLPLSVVNSDPVAQNKSALEELEALSGTQATGVASGQTIGTGFSSMLSEAVDELQQKLLTNALSDEADMTAGLFNQIVTGSAADGSTGPQLTGLSEMLSNGGLDTDQLGTLAASLGLDTGAATGSATADAGRDALLQNFSNLSAFSALSGFGTNLNTWQKLLGQSGVEGLTDMSDLEGLS